MRHDKIPEPLYDRQHIAILVNSHEQVAPVMGISNRNPLQIVIPERIKIGNNSDAITGGYQAGHSIILFQMADDLWPGACPIK